MLFPTLLTCAALVRLSIAGYVLEDDYSPSNFFDSFDFFSGEDPTHGFVSYVDQSTAQNSNLINSTSSSVYMGVDHTNVTPNGRPSVRITSKKSYDSGLIILDLAHMPVGCGTWPAFWTVGPNWPQNGEIDIIEGVNEQSTNAVTLHTGPGCSITNTGGFSGSITTDNCDVNAAGQSTNAGCQIVQSATNSYGAGLNSNKGGVYATLWNSNAISVYFFPRGSIPSDIASESPNPSGWGTPAAMFKGGCDISSTFKSQQIVFDTTFCGDWAGAVWSSGSCASKASTCDAFVENNPSAFANAYWSINSLKVYQSSSTNPSQSAPASSQRSSSVAASSAVQSSVQVSTPYPIHTTFAISTKPAGASSVVASVPPTVYTTLTLTQTVPNPGNSVVTPVPTSRSAPAEVTLSALPISFFHNHERNQNSNGMPAKRNERKRAKHLLEHRKRH